MNDAIDETTILPEENIEDSSVTCSGISAGESEPLDNESAADTESEADNAAPINYTEIEKRDIDELRGIFPEMRDIRSITELDNPLRFAQLRDLGLTAREAYLATQKREQRYDNRSHLRSSVPGGAKSGGVSMSSEALEEARELFSGLSDTEIQKLYKKVIK